MINYFLFFGPFIFFNILPIFIYNLDNLEIDGNLTIMNNFSNLNNMNINTLCQININNINFKNPLNLHGNIILQNISILPISEYYNLLAVNNQGNIVKKYMNPLDDFIVADINGLNNNLLEFRSVNNIYVGSSSGNININCQDLLCDNIVSNNIIFEDTITVNNKTSLNNVVCQNLNSTKASIFIKSPLTIFANNVDIGIIENKNNIGNSLIIQGLVNIENPIKINSIYVKVTDNVGNNLVCLDGNNKIGKTTKINNFSLDTNSIVNETSLQINNVSTLNAKSINISAPQCILNSLGGTSINIDIGLVIGQLNINGYLEIIKYFNTRTINANNYIINSLKKPINFVVNNADSNTVLSPQTKLNNVQSTSNYNYLLFLKSYPEDKKDIYRISKKQPKSIDFKMRDILYTIYNIISKIDLDVFKTKIKKITQSYKKEYKKYIEYINEEKALLENVTQLENYYNKMKDQISEEQKEKVEKILIQLLKIESIA